MYTILHLLLLSLRDLTVDIFTQAILLSVRWTKHARDIKKWDQFLGTSWMWNPSGKPRPGVRTMFPPFTVLQLAQKKKKVLSDNLMTQDTDSYWYSRWEKMLPVFCNQTVDECRHQDPAEIGPNAEPKATSECHEMLRSASDFRLVLSREREI